MYIKKLKKISSSSSFEFKPVEEEFYSKQINKLNLKKATKYFNHQFNNFQSAFWAQ